MRLIPAITTSVVLVCLTAACGTSDKPKSSPSTTSAAASSSTLAGDTATTAGAVTGAATTPVSVAATHPAAHLVAVRAARQDTVDRVVFEFSERVPGYKVGYSPKPIVATSGKEVALAGSAALVVRLEQASGFNQDTGQPTYNGPKDLKPGDTRAVKDLAQVEDFEAVLSWAVGVTSQAAFRVSTLTAPPRLVIDIAS